jgi:hypothetical protein
MRLMHWLHDRLSPSKDVQDALEESAKGVKRAHEFRREVKEAMDPLRPILAHNHFEESVQRVFMRRPTHE